jgi:hypothetical protein
MSVQVQPLRYLSGAGLQCMPGIAESFQLTGRHAFAPAVSG